MMTENKLRIGNFTSSEITALMSLSKDKKDFGKPGLTYIEEKNMERRLCRSIDKEENARPLTWGKFMELRCFKLLPLEYKLSSQETIMHPDIDYWSGSQDGEKFAEEKTVIDIKCPITLKSFCNLVDPLYEGLTGMDAMNAIRDRHNDGDKYFHQLVSNAIITGSKFAELIIHCPYRSELPEIREMASNYDGENPFQYKWIHDSFDAQLPYIIDGGYYKNINIIRFEVPEADKQLMTANVIKAGNLLIDRFKLKTNE